MPVPSGVLSDESVKKSCAAFFPSNFLVAEELDPVPPYEPNSFFSGIKQPPRVSRVRPKRPYDDLSTFLSMANNVEMIPKAIDDYNEAAEKLYEKKGTGFATTSSVQQPLKEDDDNDFGERPGLFMQSMAAGLLSLPLMFLYRNRRDIIPSARQENAARRVEPQLEPLGVVSDLRRGVFGDALSLFDSKPERGQYTPLAKAMLSMVKSYSPFGTINPSVRSVLDTFDGTASAHQIMSRMEESTYVDVPETDFGGRYDPNIVRMTDYADLNLAYNHAMHAGGENHPSSRDIFDSSFKPNEDPYP